MRNPIVDIERCACGLEIALVEDKQELILIREALDHMRLALGKVPDVTFIELLVLVATKLINCRD